MPFIDCKITKSLTEEKKDALKSELGQSIGILHKSEGYLMVGVADNYTLYFAGKKLEYGAFVSVSLFGEASAPDCERMTARICAILRSELGIDAKNVYITYQGFKNWGWNGGNF